jgi:hydroxyacylglutathione hydrolase
MKVLTVKSEGLAHNSYILISQGEAAVIDPRRDCEIYDQLAKKECAKIKYILETHRHEDFVVGSLELQEITKAQIAHGEGLPFKYGEHQLSDGDTLNVGNIKIKTLSTPGHTNESVCYTISSANSREVKMIFTGDTLFAGSVGRTDLFGKAAQQTQAKKLYESLHGKILLQGDHTLVYPSHGVGSICGHGISGQEPTTIGYERKNNPYLQLGREELIEKVSSEELVVPTYFRMMEELNINGPPILSKLAYPKPLTLAEFEEHFQSPAIEVVDTRLPYAFCGSHIPNSINIWLGGTSVYPGWVLNINQHIVVVLERENDMYSVAARFRRLGFDNVCGYLCGGMNIWQEAGKPISRMGILSAKEAKAKLEWGEVTLLDVREPMEWNEEGVVDGAELVFFGDLPRKTGNLPRDKPIVVTCSVGNRSSIAASILERAAFKEVFNMLGGMTAWTNLGYPTKKP